MGNFYMPHPPGIHFGTINRGSVPSSFVPMQVTRQSVHHHPKTQPVPVQQKQQSQQRQPPQQPYLAQSVPEQVANPDLIDKAWISAAPDNCMQATLLTPKPPGSRLAIRFNGP